MQLQKLTMQHFRNYKKRTFAFPQNTTVFIGPNAIGKSNILEAIFLLSTGKSFRADLDREMIEWEHEVGRVTGKIMSSPTAIGDPINEDPRIRKDDSVGDEAKLEVVLTTGLVQGQKAQVKKFLVNGIARRQHDFAANLTTVLFEPEDLDLVRGSPSLRRKYLDHVLMQVDREYRRSLFSYEKGVRQRNRLLERIREGEAHRSQLLFWDQLLIKNGQYINHAREQLVAALNDSKKPFGDFHVMYDASLISELRLKQYEVEEVAAATTLVGPHRDDLQFFEHVRDMSKYGSRGEQRLVVLWLKLSELDYVKDKRGERPLLLLDDIFSELDHGHREEVMKITGLQQTIITTADVHFLPKNLVKQVEMVELS